MRPKDTTRMKNGAREGRRWWEAPNIGQTCALQHMGQALQGRAGIILPFAPLWI